MDISGLLACLGFLVASFVLGLGHLTLHQEMVEAVNTKLAKDHQFEEFEWGPLKTLDLLREYRRLYPEGRLLLQQVRIEALGLLLLAAFAWLIGLGIPVAVFFLVAGSFGLLLLYRGLVA
jgi:hypothetical protein